MCSVKNKLPQRFGMKPEWLVHLAFRFGSKPTPSLEAKEKAPVLPGPLSCKQDIAGDLAWGKSFGTGVRS
jgi:hypothetical protein